MAIGWMRLDTDFYHDMKFRALVKKHGKACAFDAICIYTLCHQNYGVLDLNDEMVKLWVLDELGLSEKSLMSTLEKLADCSVIDRDLLKLGKVTSERLSNEGLKKKDSEDKRRLAGIKSGEARRTKAEQVFNT